MSWEWIYLILAIIFEIIWGFTLKSTEGFTKFIPSVITITACGAGLYFISLSVKFLPIAIVYPIFTGLGGVGVAVCSFLFDKEKLSSIQIFGILIVLVGSVGLKLAEIQ
ncbi:multidrug efflux SMR transporter [Okeania sp.]|uniref:DMT family transporter n=1 Tax=Okeania sp. TaxID=3100323 RepID=UPI002B4AE0D3|nr:multidrug efflux SMR transporter [Okeania sp.]MEB3343645.1 multidrug efflux SMR transporter [Okeania sp.]